MIVGKLTANCFGAKYAIEASISIDPSFVRQDLSSKPFRKAGIISLTQCEEIFDMIT
jgi:hypothetical protein